MSGVETIHQAMMSNIDDKFDKSNGSFVFDVTRTVAIEIEERDAKIDTLLDKVDVENLGGEDLTKFVFQRTGLSRRSATYASTNVIINGAPSAVINAGDLVAAGDIFYRAVNQAVLDENGTAQVLVQCTQPGIIGNVPVGAINSFPVTLPNITSVTNPIPVMNGYDGESDESLRKRYYEKIQHPGKSGNKYHYLEWAKSVPGVGKAKVFPKYNGPLTMRVAVIDANGALASQSLLDEVRSYIESQMPFGVEELSIVTASELIIDISGKFILKNGYSWDDVAVNMKNKVSNYFKEIAFEEGIDYVSYAQVGREILEVDGIEDYSDLLLNGSNGNIPIGELEIPVVGGISNDNNTL